MSEEISLSLKPTSIMEVPLHIYEDFTFVVNGENYKTNKIIADLLSNAVCKMHLIDPTLSEFTIDTEEKGDFSKIIKLADFTKHKISKSEFPFVAEALNKIESKYIDIFNKEFEIIEDDTVFDRFNQHIKNPDLYSKYINQETIYLAANFYNFIQNDELIQNKLTVDELDRILRNPKLQIESEDQLLNIIIKLYQNDVKYSPLFQHVQFRNVSKEVLADFTTIFDIDNLTGGIWKAINIRTIYGALKIDDYNPRYHKKQQFNYSSYSKFDGILNYLRSKKPDNIFNEIGISASSTYNSDEQYSPKNAIFYENSKTIFCTQHKENSWICFDFKERRIVPDYYSIRSANLNKNAAHPKSWVIEGSSDNENWDLLDKRENNSSLNGANSISSFGLQNPNSSKYRFIRMRLSENWLGNLLLCFNNFELFGTLL